MAKFDAVEFQTKIGLKVLFRTLEGKDAEKFLDFRKQIADETTNTINFVGQEYRSQAHSSYISCVGGNYSATPL